MTSDDQKDSKQNKDNEQIIMNQTLVDTLQNVIDEGQLIHAFTIYRVFKENGFSINIPEKNLKLWTQAYIELLRNNQLYVQANQSIKTSVLDIIKDANKKNTKIYFNVTCKKCNKQVDLDPQYQCVSCQTQALCGVCQQPLNKGLLVWCQQCSHAIHATEVKQWFQNYQECPTGCGHMCFYISSQND